MATHKRAKSEPVPVTVTSNPRRKDIELYVLLNEDGSYVVGSDREEVELRYDDAMDRDCGHPRRMIKIILDTPLPTPTTIKGKVTVA